METESLYRITEVPVEGGNPMYAPNTTPMSYTVQPQLLRRDDKLGAVGILTKQQLRNALLGDETPWMLGTMIRGLLADSRPAKGYEVEKVVVPAWVPAFFAALEIPTIYGKPIEARTDDQDIWEMHWVRAT